MFQPDHCLFILCSHVRRNFFRSSKAQDLATQATTGLFPHIYHVISWEVIEAGKSKEFTTKSVHMFTEKKIGILFLFIFQETLS